jgi:hypothetical protein
MPCVGSCGLRDAVGIKCSYRGSREAVWENERPLESVEAMEN